jgi:hypothetical protein
MSTNINNREGTEMNDQNGQPSAVGGLYAAAIANLHRLAREAAVELGRNPDDYQVVPPVEQVYADERLFAVLLANSASMAFELRALDRGRAEALAAQQAEQSAKSGK